MGKPAGAIQASDGGWPVVEDPTYVPFSVAVFLQPNHWATSSDRYPTFAAYHQITVEASATHNQRFTSLAPVTADTQAGAVAATWYELDTSGPLYPAGDKSLGPSTFTEQETLPYADHYNVEAWTDGATQDSEIQALAFIETFDQDYGDPEPELIRYLEPCARNVDANSWRPYDHDRPVSSWLLKRIISIGYDRILYQTRQAWSILP